MDYQMAASLDSSVIPVYALSDKKNNIIPRNTAQRITMRPAEALSPGRWMFYGAKPTAANPIPVWVPRGRLDVADGDSLRELRLHVLNPANAPVDIGPCQLVGHFMRMSEEDIDVAEVDLSKEGDEGDEVRMADLPFAERMQAEASEGVDDEIRKRTRANEG